MDSLLYLFIQQEETIENVQNGSAEFKIPAPVSASPKTTKSAPSPGFKGQQDKGQWSEPPPGFKGGQKSAPPPGFKSDEEEGQGDSFVTAVGTKRSNSEGKEVEPSTKKIKTGM